MSTEEYDDLFNKCQDDPNAKYHMFTFDIVESKKLSVLKLITAETDLKNIIIDTYTELEKIEKENNKKILVFEKDFMYLDEKKRFTNFGYKQEPFVFGDTVGLTVYRNSISDKKIIEIFDKYKNLHQYNYKIHYADGFYETNNYEDGNTKYFRGYCLAKLSNIHKMFIQKEIIDDELTR